MNGKNVEDTDVYEVQRIIQEVNAKVECSDDHKKMVRNNNTGEYKIIYSLVE